MRLSWKLKSNKNIYKQPTLVEGKPVFGWRLGNLIDDDEGDMGEIIQNV